MSLIFKQDQFAQDHADLITYIRKDLGLLVSEGESYRTQTQQNAYRLGLKITNDGKLKKDRVLSRAKISQHQNRLAFDLNIFKVVDGKPKLLDPRKNESDRAIMQQIGQKFESMTPGNNSYAVGENWDDFHFEHKS